MRRKLAALGAGSRPGFRLRGLEVSRVEGFSDAVFGFALTLLVVSLEVPRTFDELLAAMRGLPAFAVSFALLMVVWYGHYLFFRRYGLEDTLTITLNAFLLFVVLFYVYPLKFLFTVFFAQFTAAGAVATLPGGAVVEMIRQRDVPHLFEVYGAGYAAVSLIFALLHRHAYRRRADLALTPLEIADTRAEIVRYLLLAGVGLLSMLCAVFVPVRGAGLAGFVYFLVGFIEAFHGAAVGRRRKGLAHSSPESPGSPGSPAGTSNTNVPPSALPASPQPEDRPS